MIRWEDDYHVEPPEAVAARAAEAIIDRVGRAQHFQLETIASRRDLTLERLDLKTGFTANGEPKYVHSETARAKLREQADELETELRAMARSIGHRLYGEAAKVLSEKTTANAVENALIERYAPLEGI